MEKGEPPRQRRERTAGTSGEGREGQGTHQMWSNTCLGGLTNNKGAAPPAVAAKVRYRDLPRRRASLRNLCGRRPTTPTTSRSKCRRFTAPACPKLGAFHEKRVGPRRPSVKVSHCFVGRAFAKMATEVSHFFVKPMGHTRHVIRPSASQRHRLMATLSIRWDPAAWGSIVAAVPLPHSNPQDRRRRQADVHLPQRREGGGNE